ncbi:MAG TPA: hypothetical protein VNV86_02530, partial [Candidatus Acidoferrum sp.]|nr:hypothetical protein [Candidatus Acidoferrum sp.]
MLTAAYLIAIGQSGTIFGDASTERKIQFFRDAARWKGSCRWLSPSSPHEKSGRPANHFGFVGIAFCA